METIKCIKTRRSRRKFLNRDVSDELIRKIIDCARRAPFSGDAFSCEFIIVKDKSVKKKLSDVREGANEPAIMTSSALIIICIDAKDKIRWLENGVVAAENILLATHDYGLGAVYTTAFHPTKKEITAKIQKILNLPNSIMPVCIIPIGYPDPSEKIEKKELRDVQEMIHFDKW